MNYKDTIRLPRTNFSMKGDLIKAEPEMLLRWEEMDIEGQISAARRSCPPFVLHDGPPYANGHVHLGTALNKILKDFIVKSHTMMGYYSPYVPGWDCHGMPIEHKVVTSAVGEDLSRLEIRRRCREYAAKYVDVQRSEFKRLGVFGRWEKPYLTMSYSYEAGVLRAFEALVRAGHIYRGLRPIHWCTSCSTALADAEVEYAVHSSPSVYVAFSASDPAAWEARGVPAGTEVVIWTTTPWTLPANLAVALNPGELYCVVEADGRRFLVASRLAESFIAAAAPSGTVLPGFSCTGASLERLLLVHPLDASRTSLVISALHVTMEDGTGCVHTAPGHGADDFNIGREYGLEVFCPVLEDGKFGPAGGKYAGLHVFAANPVIVSDLQASGRLLASQKVSHSYPHCWRCKSPLIIRATEQFFLDLSHGGLKDRVLAAVDSISWHPSWGYDRMKNMMASRPDWCLSRQRNWGVGLPVFICRDCDHTVMDPDMISHVASLVEESGSDAWFSKSVPELFALWGGTPVCPACGSSSLRKNEDILDVWFDSSVSHHNVLTPEFGLSRPCSVYLEATDQHRGWFGVSLITSVGMGLSVPARNIITHGLVQDSQGKKMSKSLGNVVSPLEIVNTLGADILRLWFASVDYTADFRAEESQLADAREGYRKIRNTLRFLLGNLEGVAGELPPSSSFTGLDRYIWLRFRKLVALCQVEYRAFQFHRVYRELRNFMVVDLSGLYLDVRKDRLYCDAVSSPLRSASVELLGWMASGLLRLLAPIMPFTCEEAWGHLPSELRTVPSVHLALLPSVEELTLAEEEELFAWRDALAVRDAALKVLEEMRAAGEIGGGLEASVTLGLPSSLLDSAFGESWADLLIVSSVGVVPSETVTASAVRAPGSKCPRCWKVHAGTGLCPRCSSVVDGIDPRKGITTSEGVEMSKLVEQFTIQLKRLFASGMATEHSYRPALQALLQGCDESIQPINEPKRQKCGAPDFVVRRHEVPIGYIECKDVDESLDNPGKQAQFKRYMEALDNLVVTNGVEWRLFIRAEEKCRVSIGAIAGGKLIVVPEQFENLLALVNSFITTKSLTVKSSKELARMMARKAHALRHAILTTMNNTAEEDQRSDDLFVLLRACQRMLVHDMTKEAFSDLVAQTVTYGFFTARVLDPTPDTFDRAEAVNLIPGGNTFLRKFFKYISGSDLDDNLNWIIDDTANLFRHVDPAEILKYYGEASKRNDPILHFYEEFLGQYDRKMKKSMGVFYTPEAVVDFIVRAIDEVLRTRFDMTEGLRTAEKVGLKTGTGRNKKTTEYHRVQVLDPAMGTGTFLNRVITLISEPFQENQGVWNPYVKENLLPRIHGFECMAAPYAVAHLKLAATLQRLSYSEPASAHFSLCLTNSLEVSQADYDSLFGQWLSDEVRNASHIKDSVPVMVVLGNPPYLGLSKNMGEWIRTKIEEYKYVDDVHFRERKHWLNDDYVKFIRLAEHFIEKNDQGVFSYVSNNGYIDNPTFRGMRWHLARTFDEIYILNLHGSSKKKESCPDGSKDENVFDITQGVAIIVAFRLTGRKNVRALGKVFHHELYGKRCNKFQSLFESSLGNIPWKQIDLRPPSYFFVPKNYDLEEEYGRGISVKELFPVNSVGMVTARDGLTIHKSKEDMWSTVADFANLSVEEAREKYGLGEDVQSWKVSWAQKDVRDSGLRKELIVPVTYRPFDVRYTYYTGNSGGFICRPIAKLMRHFIEGSNIGLVAPRQTKEAVGGFITKNIIGHKAFSSYDINTVFPLYLYFHRGIGEAAREPNLAKSAIEAFSRCLNMDFDPQSEGESASDKLCPMDIFDYTYSILHSSNYRKRYIEYLKTDFPKIPYPQLPALFWKLVTLGKDLRQIHLLEHPKLRETLALPVKFPISGSNKVKSGELRLDSGRVMINSDQYFNPVTEDSWNFPIGGFYPAQKWLKDRDNYQLTMADIQHYQRIIVALSETKSTMESIDAAIDAHGGWPTAFYGEK